MITNYILHDPNANEILGLKDLDTKYFILLLYKSDVLDISNAKDFLNNLIEVKSPLEELALNF